MKQFKTSLIAIVCAMLLSVASFSLVGCGDKNQPTEPGDLTALSTPTGLAYADGTLTWQAVTGADSGYTVTVTQGQLEKLNQTTNATSVSVATLAAGTYKATVKANAVPDKNKESAAATLDFTVEQAPVQAEKLAAPTDIAYDKATQTIGFTAVPNASAYIVSATVKDGTTVTIESHEITETSFSVTGLTTAEHTVSIVAKGNGTTYTNSDAATFALTIEANKLATVTDIAYAADTDVLSWSAVAGAEFYEVEVKQGSEVIFVDDELVENEVDASAWPSGEFTVSVKAGVLEDNIYEVSGDAANDTFTIASLGVLKAPQNLKVEGGALVWDENNARGYTLELKRKTGTTVGEAVTVTPVWGDCALNIAAMGLESGGYVASIKATSNRHASAESAAVEKDFTVEVVRKFMPEDIATFDGNMPRGEHGKVEKVTLGGVDYARVQPTADGWGRICSPDVTVDWDSKPVVYLEMGNVVGGYHMELYYNGNKVNCLRDTQNTESTVVDLIAQVVKEGGDAADYVGIRTVALRLGVDHSTTTQANDAIADYKSVTVMYVTDYVQGLTEETKLTTPTGMMIDAFGVMSFDGVRYAKTYEVTVKNTQTNAQVGEKKVLNAPSLDLKEFAAGEYELSIVARNADEPLALDSDAATFNFAVEQVAAFTAEELATSGENAKFVSCDNNLQAAYDIESQLAVVNGLDAADPDAKIKDWGTIQMKDGLNVNFSRNPIVMVDVDHLTGGNGWYAKASWEGQGAFYTNNDTITAITSATTLTIRAGWNSDNSQLGVGEKAGYKFQFGVTGGGTTAYLSGIRIVQIYANSALPRPDQPEQLSRPSGITVHDRATVKANTVAGNAEYAPTYKITVAEKGNAENVVVELTKQELPQILLSRYELESGKTYTVSIVAEGDTYNDSTKPFFSDSEAATLDIEYTLRLKVDDFSSYITEGEGVMWQYVDGGNTIAAAKDGKALTISTQNDWGMISLPVFTGDIAAKTDLTEISALEFHFGEVTGDPQFTSRYFDFDEEGKPIWSDGRGDTSIKNNDILVETNLHKRVTFTTIDGQNAFYVGVGFGSANGNNARSYQLVKLVIADYKVVTAA